MIVWALFLIMTDENQTKCGKESIGTEYIYIESTNSQMILIIFFECSKIEMK